MIALDEQDRRGDPGRCRCVGREMHRRFRRPLLPACEAQLRGIAQGELAGHAVGLRRIRIGIDVADLQDEVGASAADGFPAPQQPAGQREMAVQVAENRNDHGGDPGARRRMSRGVRARLSG